MSLVDWIYPRKCVGCGVRGEYVCKECERVVDVRGGSLRYSRVVRKLIKEIKYRGTWDMVKALVNLWEKRVGMRGERGIVTCVPMWEPKRKLRGYNQAELIARELAKRWGTPYKELLVRTRETKPMYGLDRKIRKLNVQNAFSITTNNQGSIINNSTVILVDDVWTSGATMNECARILSQAGWRKIIQLAIAS